MTQQQEEFAKVHQQLLVLHYLVELGLFYSSRTWVGDHWYPETILDHASALVGEYQHTGRERKVLVHVLEVVDDFLVFNQLS